MLGAILLFFFIPIVPAKPCTATIIIASISCDLHRKSCIYRGRINYKHT